MSVSRTDLEIFHESGQCSILALHLDFDSAVRPVHDKTVEAIPPREIAREEPETDSLNDTSNDCMHPFHL